VRNIVSRGVIQSGDKYFYVSSDVDMVPQIIKQAYKFKPDSVDMLIKLANATFGHVGWITPYAAKQAKAFSTSSTCSSVYKLNFSAKKLTVVR